MSPKEYTLSRIRAVLNEIERLKGSEFPYPHSLHALRLLHDQFQKHFTSINGLPGDKDVGIVRQYCEEASIDLFRYLRFLGFILRSTNVRNAFELYGPLLRLCRRVLGTDTKLILSSEWESYSPFIFNPIQALPKYVLIGLPAPECANPLLIPLAGHELGHTLWRENELAKTLRKTVEEAVLSAIERSLTEFKQHFPHINVADVAADQLGTNIFVKGLIAQPTELALKQTEESFCDCVGLYIFNSAYFHAFAYLLAPASGGTRPAHYPNTIRRIDHLKIAAKSFSEKLGTPYEVPKDYSTMFGNKAEPHAKDFRAKYLLTLADAAAATQIPGVIDRCQTLLNGLSGELFDPKVHCRILEAFRFVVPAPRSGNISNIVNAAWTVYHEDVFWERIEGADQKLEVLKELTLKSLEVLEIEQLTA